MRRIVRGNKQAESLTDIQKINNILANPPKLIKGKSLYGLRDRISSYQGDNKFLLSIKNTLSSNKLTRLSPKQVKVCEKIFSEIDKRNKIQAW